MLTDRLQGIAAVRELGAVDGWPRGDGEVVQGRLKPPALDPQQRLLDVDELALVAQDDGHSELPLAFSSAAVSTASI